MNFLDMIKGIYETPTANIYKVKIRKLSQDQKNDTDAHFPITFEESEEGKHKMESHFNQTATLLTL